MFTNDELKIIDLALSDRRKDILMKKSNSGADPTENEIKEFHLIIVIQNKIDEALHGKETKERSI